ncbi:MAG: mechanosensitive ion channel [Rhodospirillales bacterium]|nr:mechanosensitive ion channel [Rhodospirillales bacterium]
MRFSLWTCSRLLLIAGAFIALFMTIAPAGAAAPDEPQGVSTKDLRALASSIEDEGKRKELLATINALIAAKESEPPLQTADVVNASALSFVSDIADEAHVALTDVANYFNNWPLLTSWINTTWNAPEARSRSIDQILAFISIFAAGWIAEYVVWRLLSPKRHQLGSSARPGMARALAILARTLLDLFPMCAFFAAGYGVSALIEPATNVRAVGLNFVNAYVIGRVLITGSRMLLAPSAPSLRLLPIGDAAARTLSRWSRLFVIVGVAGFFLIGAAVLFGMPKRGAQALLVALGLILTVLAIVFVLRYRRTVADWLHAHARAASKRLGAAQLLHGLSTIWHILVIAYIAGFFIVAAFQIQGGFSFMMHGTLWSIAIAVGAWLALIATRHFAEHLRHAAATDPTGASTLRNRALYYVPLAHTFIRLIVCAATIVCLLEAWNFSAFAALERPFSQRAMTAGFDILLVVAFAILVWEIASNAIEHYLTISGRDGTAVQRSARVRTLLPLLRKALFIVLTVMVTLISLAEIGIDIAPLLAGAGVLGLAVGFGAQKLVQDVITGIFLLIEDALAVGDVVTVAGIGGLVEDMSIRSIRLRDLSGNVHTVPFSTVDTVTNMTKDFSYYLLDIGVAYREDTDEVAEVCRQIVEELRAEETFAADILEPLEVLGVDQFADSAVIVKARIKTRPIKQWAVGREFNRRMKKRFDELGIEIPFPHQTIYFGVDKRGKAPPAFVHLDPALSASPASQSAPDQPETGEPGQPPAPPGNRPEAAALPSAPTTATDDVISDDTTGKLRQATGGAATPQVDADKIEGPSRTVRRTTPDLPS